MDVGEGTKKRMLCEMTSKSVCSDIPVDKVNIWTDACFAAAPVRWLDALV